MNEKEFSDPSSFTTASKSEVAELANRSAILGPFCGTSGSPMSGGSAMSTTCRPGVVRLERSQLALSVFSGHATSRGVRIGGAKHDLRPGDWFLVGIRDGHRNRDELGLILPAANG
jgi:hypothetical protein